MRTLVFLLLFPAAIAAQKSYIGIGMNEQVGFSTLQEIDLGIAVFNFNLLAARESTLSMRIGAQVGKGNLRGVFYIPMMKIRLSDLAYKTPFSAECRFLTEQFLFVAGLEYGFSGTPTPYLSVMAAFK